MRESNDPKVTLGIDVERNGFGAQQGYAIGGTVAVPSAFAPLLVDPAALLVRAVSASGCTPCVAMRH